MNLYDVLNEVINSRDLKIVGDHSIGKSSSGRYVRSIGEYRGQAMATPSCDLVDEPVSLISSDEHFVKCLNAEGKEITCAINYRNSTISIDRDIDRVSKEFIRLKVGPV